MSIQKSSIIAGTMNWGKWGRNFNQTDIQQLITTCVKEGVSTFDHADIYGGYTTEADFGNAWGQMDIDRKEVQFITKCGIKYVCEEREYGIKHYDYTKEHIVWSVENSLKNYSFLSSFFFESLIINQTKPTRKCSIIIPATTYINVFELPLITPFW